MALWDAKYATGNEMVDNDHKAIFDLVDNVLSSSFIESKEKVEIAINFLAEYVVAHFAREEELMKESGFPRAERHTAEHETFKRVATQFINDFRDGAYALGEREEYPDTKLLSKFIKDIVIRWLVEHVMGSDAALARHYKKWKEDAK